MKKMQDMIRKLFVLDSRGKPSITKVLVVIAFIVCTFKVIVGGFLHFPVVSLAEYASALLVLFGAWWTREKTEKDRLSTTGEQS